MEKKCQREKVALGRTLAKSFSTKDRTSGSQGVLGSRRYLAFVSDYERSEHTECWREGTRREWVTELRNRGADGWSGAPKQVEGPPQAGGGAPKQVEGLLAGS